MEARGHAPTFPRSGLAAAGVGAAVAALVLVRLALAGDAFDRVWAEDGRVFLGDAQQHGLGSLVYAYGGYLQTVPRLISLAFAPLPLEAYGTYAVLAAGALTGLLGGFVYAAAAEISGSPRLALIPALAMALAPALAVESLGNLANLHWFLVFAGFWALLVQPGPRLRIASTAVALAAGLSSVVAVLLVPVALAAHGRAALRGWPLRALLTGVVLQAVALVASPESPAGVERNPGLGLRELGEGVIGTLGAETDDPSADVALRVAFGALLAGLLVWMWLSAQPRDRRRAAWPWATGAVIFSITFLVTGGSAPRYEALLAMFLAAGVCLLAISANRRALAATLAVMLALVALEFPAADLRLSGPSWQRTVERFEQVCLVPGTSEADVPVSPAGWSTARLRCDG